MQAKKKKKTSAGPLKGLCVLVMILLSGYFARTIFFDLHTYATLKASIESNQKLLEEVKTKKEDMQTQKNNLTNPDYIEYLARGKYLVTKENEQIFKFPPIDKKNSEDAAK